MRLTTIETLSSSTASCAGQDAVPSKKQRGYFAPQGCLGPRFPIGPKGGPIGPLGPHGANLAPLGRGVTQGHKVVRRLEADICNEMVRPL